MSMPALELIGISKRYGPVQANDAVDLRVARQSIHALVGENGAGKSTLMRIAYGLARPDSGTIRIKGETISGHTVAQSIARGVGMVHQHFMLVGPLSVAENVVLGREPRRAGLLDLARAAHEITELSRRFGLDVDPHARVEDLSVGQQQRVEILKVLWRGCDVLILDEPTAVLTPGEVRELFAVLRTLVKDGMTIVLITHKLDEVVAIADHVSVMRRGAVVAEMDSHGPRGPDKTVASGLPARRGEHRSAAYASYVSTGAQPQRSGRAAQQVLSGPLSAGDIARAMVGRPVLLHVDKPAATPGETIAEITDLHVQSARGIPAVRGVSLTLHAGEIVGIAGVEGNGQSELVEAIVGLRAVESGRILVAGQDITDAPVAARYRAGLAHVPEDRHGRALVLDFSIKENLVLGQQDEFTGRAGFLDDEHISAYAGRLIDEFDIRPPDPEHITRGMSGGNQQKIVIARELSRPAPKLLVCAQPTRGVDIGAIEAIHRRMIEARGRGLAVLLLSADLGELEALSDRLAVIYKGRIVATLGPDELGAAGTRERVGALMTGAAPSSEAAS